MSLNNVRLEANVVVSMQSFGPVGRHPSHVVSVRDRNIGDLIGILRKEDLVDIDLEKSEARIRYSAFGGSKNSLIPFNGSGDYVEKNGAVVLGYDLVGNLCIDINLRSRLLKLDIYDFSEESGGMPGVMGCSFNINQGVRVYISYLRRDLESLQSPAEKIDELAKVVREFYEDLVKVED